MKIESIYHSKNVRKKENKGDRPINMVSKDPIHHPFLLEREYVRALNATKIDRMLAKPFIAALSHHKEGINKLAKSYSSSHFLSSSYDNKVILWELKSREIISQFQMKEPVNAITLDSNNNVYITQEKTFKNYTLNNNIIYTNNYKITSLDSLDNTIASGTTNGIAIFDINRITPKCSFRMDDVTNIKYNRSFKYLIGGIERMKINIADTRSQKEVLCINSENNICMNFSQKEGFLFCTGNEDGNAYLYDLRNYEKPLGIYRGHTNAVVSIAFSPNGKEIATGSFDKTIRIFNKEDRKSKDCYYNDRMQLVHGVEYSNDGMFIISGSDDSSLRIWKADASRKSGAMSKMEKASLSYKEALKEKFKDVGEISRISSHRFLNKEIKHEARIKHEKYEGEKRREEKRKNMEKFKEECCSSEKDSEQCFK